MSTNKLILIIVGVLLLIGVGAYDIFFSRTQVRTPYVVLMQKNTDFANAEQLVSAKKYPQAIQAYNAALAKATDPLQAGQIKIKIAAVTDLSGDPTKAIQMMKQIIADPISYAPLRAYAAQYIASILLYRNGDPGIHAEIFKDAPYSAMVVPDKPRLTSRRLNEYAYSFYPLGLSGLRIANWYVNDIIYTQKSTSTPAAINDLQIIQGFITNANGYIVRMKTDANASQEIPAVLKLKAVLLGKLVSVGDAKEEDADAAFQAAFQSWKEYRITDDSILRYYYASYLASFGNTRSADMKVTLAPFSTDSSYASSAAASFFKTERQNLLGQKADLQRLAKLDPDFKKFLMSMGWTSSDFAVATK